MIKKSEKGCLVIHGLTGTPATMKPMIDELINAGYVVNAPLLPGHGTNVEDLVHTTWQDWWDAVLNAYNELKQQAGKVSCVGLSLGSLLTLRLAVEMRWGVRAIVAMGTPLVLNPLIEKIAYPLVKYTPIKWFYHYSNKDWEKSVSDPEGREYYRRHSYGRLPIRSVFEVFKLKKLLAPRIKEITPPVFVVHGGRDTVAPLKNVNILKKELGSNMIDVMVLNRSEHVVSLDYDREVTAKAVVAFLNRFS